MSFLNTAKGLDFDPECYRLACHFTDEHAHTTEDQRRRLAHVIQMTIEDWMEDEDEFAKEREQCAYESYCEAQMDERRLERRRA